MDNPPKTGREITRQELAEAAQAYLKSLEWGVNPVGLPDTDLKAYYSNRKSVVVEFPSTHREVKRYLKGAVKILEATLDMSEIVHGKGLEMISVEWAFNYQMDNQTNQFQVPASFKLACQRIYKKP